MTDPLPARPAWDVAFAWVLVLGDVIVAQVLSSSSIQSIRSVATAVPSSPGSHAEIGPAPNSQ